VLAFLRGAGSGRRLGVGLILLALWLQALAPVARLRQEAVRGLQSIEEAIAGAILCGHAPAGPDSATAPSAPAHAAHHDCPFCRSHVAAPVPVTPAPVVRRLAWHAAAWPIPPPPRPLRPPPSPRLARAPPAV